MYLTVKELKAALDNVPDTTEVYYQRIEDFYFKEMNWTGIRMSWDNNSSSDYIRAFSCYLHPDTKKFVINAHY